MLSIRSVAITTISMPLNRCLILFYLLNQISRIMIHLNDQDPDSTNILFSTHQDPGLWEGGLVARAARDALLTKYSLLPLLYTLFFVHSTAGETVVRPLWHEFPTDSKTRDIDTQVRSWSCLIPFSLFSSFGEVPSLSPQSWSRVLRNGRTTLE